MDARLATSTGDFLVDAQAFLSLHRWQWLRGKIASLEAELAELREEEAKIEEWAAVEQPEFWANAQELRDAKRHRRRGAN